MILLLVLVGVAIAALFAGWWAVRGRTVGRSDPEQLMRQIRHVDLPALRSLFDMQDEEYLRSHVSPQDFRVWQKMRVYAAQEYLGWISNNAVLLIAIGEMAARSSDPKVVVYGKQLANTALALRINCILAALKLRVKLFYPAPQISLNSVFDRYAKTHDSFVSLRFAQHPASSSKVFVTL